MPFTMISGVLEPLIVPLIVPDKIDLTDRALLIGSLCSLHPDIGLVLCLSPNRFACAHWCRTLLLTGY